MFEKPENITERKNGGWNIIWYNPPFSKNVNIAETKLNQVGFKLTTTGIFADGLANWAIWSWVDLQLIIYSSSISNLA